MATRSVNLKLVLRRSQEGKELRECLWLTHSVVNSAVADIEKLLLLCRGRAYVAENGLVANTTAEAEIGRLEAIWTHWHRRAVLADPFGIMIGRLEAIWTHWHGRVGSWFALFDDIGRLEAIWTHWHLESLGYNVAWLGESESLKRSGCPESRPWRLSHHAMGAQAAA